MTTEQRIYWLEQEVARLQRYIATWRARPWLETDHPDVIDCMGAVPECATNGCQFNILKSTQVTTNRKRHMTINQKKNWIITIIYSIAIGILIGLWIVYG